jgi:hypothetical protein
MPVPVEPELRADLRWIWNAWSDDLIDCRDTGGMGSVAAIRWSEASRWCEDHAIDGAERLRFVRLVRELDRAYVAHLNKPKAGPSDDSRA